MCDARKDTFESAWRAGQTRNHIILARAVGVNQMVVAVNKLDMCNWEESRYNYICDTVSEYLKKLGFKQEKITYVPISGLHGINLETRDSQPPELTSWYNEERGKHEANKVPRCLIEAIDGFKTIPRPINRPVRACIYDYYQTMQDGFSFVQGDCLSIKVESGVIKKKDKLLLMPYQVECQVKSIECKKEPIDFVYSGQICEVAVTFPNDFERGVITNGQILCDPEYIVPKVKKFVVKVIVFELEYPITKGIEISVSVFSNEIPGRVFSLDQLINH